MGGCSLTAKALDCESSLAPLPSWSELKMTTNATTTTISIFAGVVSSYEKYCM